MFQLHSSLRVVPPETTLAHAKAMASQLGITRVTEITRLDNVGIPVFASVRPSALDGSLCVNAGKGVRAIEAQVGAYMEAIEFALAEPGASRIAIIDATPRDVLDGRTRPEAILDFCPIIRTGFDLSASLACIGAEDLVTRTSVLVPAELVLLPYVDIAGTGSFGSHSNGLCSGNSLSEASLHGLLEVIERDIRSFNNVQDRSKRILADDLPRCVHPLVQSIEAAGLQLCVRTLPSEFGIPLFEAILWDPYARTPAYMNGGYGCHLIRDIALIRALTEAVQSRLSWIHGGRDDLEESALRRASQSRAQQAREAQTRFTICANWPDVIAYEESDDCSTEATSVEDALSNTIERLLRNGIRAVCRVVLSNTNSPLHVVRIIVPKLEYFDPSSYRIGPRLRDFIHHQHN